MDRLHEILQRQLYLQHIGKNRYDFTTMSTEARIVYVKEYVLALEHELHEALDEMSWKPWATREPVLDRTAYIGELIDVLHFLMNLFLVVEVSADEIYDGYIAKWAVNVSRFNGGYDGVSTKCRGCGRALDDPSVRCTTDICAEITVSELDIIHEV